MIENIVNISQSFFILFFISIYSGYLMISIISLFAVSRYLQWNEVHTLPSFQNVDIPISILSPAYNEEMTIVSSVRSLLQLNYPNYEIIIINDGSTDETLDVLIKEFSLSPIIDTKTKILQTKEVKAIYLSKKYPNLKIINKENGGKADSLNAGLNYSQTPLFCCIDADSILERDSLQLVISPFLEDETTIASGGTIRIANGCKVKDGHLEKIGLPKNPLALVQIIEYLRAFLFGRMGWSVLNSMLIISGAFGVFRRNIVIEAGGYKTNTIGEDMELIVRLHKMMRLSSRPYKIQFVPDPICWTEAPEDLKTLKNQRIRWQRGLSESLSSNLKLCFHPKGGIVGWVSFPFMVLFEWLEPLIQIIGYLTTILCYSLGIMSLETFLTFFAVTISLGILVSTNSLLLEEISFHIYPKSKNILLLFLVAILENFGYRQLNNYWRLIGVIQWIRGKKGEWGKMTRKGNWQGA